MQNNSIDPRKVLRDWIMSKGLSKDLTELSDETLIIKSGLITSVDVVDLIFIIEELGNIEIDVTELKPEMLESIEKICASFFD